MTNNASPLPKVFEGEYEDTPKVESPDIQKEELFDFFTAMKKINEGKKVSKKEWDNKETYGVLRQQDKLIILILHKDKKDHGWIIQDSDLAGTDWFVVDEK